VPLVGNWGLALHARARHPELLAGAVVHCSTKEVDGRRLCVAGYTGKFLARPLKRAVYGSCPRTRRSLCTARCAAPRPASAGPTPAATPARGPCTPRPGHLQATGWQGGRVSRKHPRASTACAFRLPRLPRAFEHAQDKGCAHPRCAAPPARPLASTGGWSGPSFAAARSTGLPACSTLKLASAIVDPAHACVRLAREGLRVCACACVHAHARMRVCVHVQGMVRAGSAGLVPHWRMHLHARPASVTGVLPLSPPQPPCAMGAGVCVRVNTHSPAGAMGPCVHARACVRACGVHGCPLSPPPSCVLREEARQLRPQ